MARSATPPIAVLNLLPEWERREWREEAAQHLAALAAAHEELGETPDEAVEAAVRQFGEPARLGKALLAESSAARRDREASRRLAWSLHVLSWDVLVTIFALSLVTGQTDWVPSGLLLTVALIVFCLGHAIGGALLGWTVRADRLGPAVVLPYALLLAAATVATGTPTAHPVADLVAASGIVAAGLAAGSAAARWAGRVNYPHPSGP